MVSAVPLELTYGAMYVGVLVVQCLFGVSIVQLYMYFSRFPEDSRYIKTYVLALMFFDIAHVIFSAMMMFDLLVTNWGDISSLDQAPWSFHFEVFTNAIVIFGVHCFFTYRVWVLSGRQHWLAGVVFSLALLQMGCAIFGSVESYGHQRFSRLHEFTGLIVLWSSTDVAADTIIACILWYYLCQSRNRTHRTDTIIDTLILFAINTGALTSTCAFLHLIFFVASPNTAVHFAFHFILCKMYTNSVYASLNARVVLRNKDSNNDFGALSSSKVSASTPQWSNTVAIKTQDSNKDVETQHEMNIVHNSRFSSSAESGRLGRFICESEGQISD